MCACCTKKKQPPKQEVEPYRIDEACRIGYYKRLIQSMESDNEIQGSTKPEIKESNYGSLKLLFKVLKAYCASYKMNLRVVNSSSHTENSLFKIFSGMMLKKYITITFQNPDFPVRIGQLKADLKAKSISLVVFNIRSSSFEIDVIANSSVRGQVVEASMLNSHLTLSTYTIQNIRDNYIQTTFEIGMQEMKARLAMDYFVSSELSSRLAVGNSQTNVQVYSLGSCSEVNNFTYCPSSTTYSEYTQVTEVILCQPYKKMESALKESVDVQCEGKSFKLLFAYGTKFGPCILSDEEKTQAIYREDIKEYLNPAQIYISPKDKSPLIPKINEAEIKELYTQINNVTPLPELKDRQFSDFQETDFPNIIECSLSSACNPFNLAFKSKEEFTPKVYFGFKETVLSLNQSKKDSRKVYAISNTKNPPEQATSINIRTALITNNEGAEIAYIGKKSNKFLFYSSVPLRQDSKQLVKDAVSTYFGGQTTLEEEKFSPDVLPLPENTFINREDIEDRIYFKSERLCEVNSSNTNPWYYTPVISNNGGSFTFYTTPEAAMSHAMPGSVTIKGEVKRFYLILKCILNGKYSNSEVIIDNVNDFDVSYFLYRITEDVKINNKVFDIGKTEKISISDVRNNKIEEPQLKAMLKQIASTMPFNPSVKELVLAKAGLGVNNITELCDILKNAKYLRKLDILSNMLNDECASRLANALTNCSQLSQLDIFENQFTSKGIIEIVKALSNTHLPKFCILKMGSVDLGNDGVKEVCNFIKEIKSLKRLDLMNSKINDAHAQMLSEELANNPNMKVLRLMRNEITSEGVKHFANLIANHEYDGIDLDYNKIDKAGVILIADAIARSTSLKVLELSGNKIGNEGIIELCERGLLQNKSLVMLGIANVGMGDESLKKLIEVLPQTKITKVDINDNPITDKGGKDLQDAISNNGSPQKVSISAENLNMSFTNKTDLLKSLMQSAHSSQDQDELLKKMENTYATPFAMFQNINKFNSNITLNEEKKFTDEFVRDQASIDLSTSAGCKSALLTAFIKALKAKNLKISINRKMQLRDSIETMLYIALGYTDIHKLVLSLPIHVKLPITFKKTVDEIKDAIAEEFHLQPVQVAPLSFIASPPKLEFLFDSYSGPQHELIGTTVKIGENHDEAESGSTVKINDREKERKLSILEAAIKKITARVQNIVNANIDVKIEPILNSVQFTSDIFMEPGFCSTDKSYTSDKNGSKIQYNAPNGWVGYTLNVSGLYENDEWFSGNNAWPMAYLDLVSDLTEAKLRTIESITSQGMAHSWYNKKDTNSMSINKGNSIEYGIWLTSNINVLSKKMMTAIVMPHNYKVFVAIQCRVKPEMLMIPQKPSEIGENDKSNDFYFVRDAASIRPFRLLIKIA